MLAVISAGIVGELALRIAVLTNLTALASLPVLKKLADSQKLELRHVFFHDTLAAGRQSLAQILRQFGPHALVTKALGVLAGKFRIAVASLRFSASRRAGRSLLRLPITFRM